VPPRPRAAPLPRLPKRTADEESDFEDDEDL
jgi:hypothetical protein